MIDIIVPVYNTPIPDLERCLNSILSSTYKEYKIYIIDDGSDTYIRKYLDNIKNKNIIIKHIKNNGVSNARNIGLSISNSKYITFIDSDDTINKNFLSESVKLLEDNNLDIIIGGMNEIKNNKISKTRTSTKDLIIYTKENINIFKDKLISSKNKEENIDINETPVGRIYTRLIKRELATKILFNINIKMSEDTLYMIDLSNYINRVGITNNIWYNYYKNDYSISNNINIDKIIPFIKEIELRLKKDNILKDSYKYRIFKTIYNNKELINDSYIKDIINKYLKDIKFNYINISKEEINFLGELQNENN